MHELSIVTYVIDQVKEIAEQNDLKDVESVTLEFGEVSGIVPEYLVDCWAWYAKKTPLIQNSKLLYETIPAVTWCNACKTTYPTIQYGKICPHCGSPETWLQQGNEMNIKQIVAYENGSSCVSQELLIRIRRRGEQNGSQYRHFPP